MQRFRWQTHPTAHDAVTIGVYAAVRPALTLMMTTALLAMMPTSGLLLPILR
jgi:hypothetical protein